MLTKQQLELFKFVGKDSKDMKGIPEGIYVTPEETVVTDGHLLVGVTAPQLSPDDFPAGQDGFTALKVWRPFILPVAVAKEIAASLKKSLIRIIQAAAVYQTGEDERGKAKTIIRTTDLETTRDFRFRELDGAYPAYKRIVDGTKYKEGAMVRFSLDAELVKKMAEAVAKFSEDCPGTETRPMLFTVSKEYGRAVRIDTYMNTDGQRMWGYIMPLRIPSEGDWRAFGVGLDKTSKSEDGDGNEGSDGR